ncbi:MAG: threonine/serine dehydratase [Gemmatimonadetes bacterium]|nr:MAG: threonine/serine dehydratase [Gemmatimonadota bacterium]
MSEPSLVTLDEIREAAALLSGAVVRTPLVEMPELCETVGAGELRLKCENLQRTGSFKARGAINFVSRIPGSERARGVITFSSGNHAQAVALAARLFGIRAVVVMPTTAPAVKRQGAEALGAEVVLEGTTSEERRARAEAIAAEQGLTIVPPFDHAHIIAGQGTVGLEVVADWPRVDTWVVCIGGGGLASGSAAAIRRLRPDARIVGVEPEGAASMRAALEAGGPVTLASTASVADGLLPVRAGALTHAHVRAFVDEVVTVSDDEIREAARWLVHRGRMVVEYSGAAATAALLAGRVDVAGRRVAAVVSGGNIDNAELSRLL